MHLAEPTPQLLEAMRQLPQPVIEIGAGDGHWLRAMRAVGIRAIGIDPNPGHDDVRRGSYEDAPRDCPTVLIVWPPAGTACHPWIAFRRWEAVCLVGSPSRMQIWGMHEPYRLTYEEILPKGRKTESLARIWRR